ncbi:MAG: hypothetical protein RLZZ618_2813 [Pseudomonadota bacterium]|jgi:cytochrome c553
MQMTSSSDRSFASSSPAKARLALLCMAVSALPGLAHAAPDAARGRDLYNDTANVEGVADSIASVCTNCHGAVQNRRAHIAGSNTSYLSYDTALNRFGSALNSIPGMSQFRALTTEQIEDIAAYISDVPYVTIGTEVQPGTSVFASSAVGTSVTKNVTITHSQTAGTGVNLRISSTNIGTPAGGFTRTNGCANVVLTAGTSCTFSVTYLPTSTTTTNVGLLISLVEGTSTVVSRNITLQGTAAGAPAPAPAPSPAPAPGPAGDSGGGALGWSWLVGLSLGTAALASRRRAKSSSL